MLSRLIVLCCTLLHFGSPTRVVLQNNGYESVVVAIDESVSHTASEQLIAAIKAAFLNASNYVYTATDRRAYFRDVRIVVPSSWPPSSEYAIAAWETFETADVRIGNIDQFDQAFTKRTIGLCGQQADYIFATPRRFTRADLQGDPAGRMLVHQWAQYRWGVYNEHPTSLSQLYSFMPHGRFEATRCTSNIKGDIIHSEYGGNCHPTTASNECGFRPSAGSSSQASVMFYQQMNEITTFCGSGASVPHNEDAMNDQNVMCNYSSTWDVILSHSDFNSGANSPTSVRLRSSDLAPTFKVVQARPYEQIVLVLDISGSMQLDGRLDRVRNAAYSLIQTVPEGTRLGIVSFNEAAHININLTEVKGDQSRRLLYNALPTTASGTTSIGLGLQAAIELIKQSNNGEVVGGCSLLVINDGNENAGSSITIDSLFDDVVSSGVRVFPITLVTLGSRSTDLATYRKLGNLARQTDGYQYLVPDIQDQRQTILCESLTSACELALPRHRRPIQLIQQSVSVPSSQPVQLNVTVDSLSQTSCYFQLTAEKYINELKVEITDPAGSLFDMSSITKAPEFALMTLNVDNIKAGIWKVRLTSSLASGSMIVAFSAISHQAAVVSAINDPIVVTADVSDRDLSTGSVPIISVAVKKGELGIANANVVASVVLPSGEIREWNLYDRGANPDHVAADGVYSGYFTDLEKRGEYGVRVAVSGTQSSITVPPSPYTDTAALYYTNREISKYLTGQRQATEQFSRAISGGMFLTEYLQPVDLYPPCRITDLRIAGMDYNTSQVRLSWSAPGEDYDRGVIQKYYIKYAENDPSALRKSFSSQKQLPLSWIEDDTRSILRSQRPAGQIEYLNITVPDRDNVTYYFTVTAEDGKGIEGPPSPVVSIALLPLQYPIRIKESSSGISTGVLAAIIACCSLAAVVVVVVVVLVCLKRHRNRESVRDDDGEKMKLHVSRDTSIISSSSARKDKRDRRAKKKRLATEEREYMIATDVVSQVTDTTYVNITISEPDLQHQQETQEKQLAHDKEELEKQKQVETVQIPTQSNQRQKEDVQIDESEHETSLQKSDEGTHKELSFQDFYPDYDHVEHTKMQYTQDQNLTQQPTQPTQANPQLQTLDTDTTELFDRIEEQPMNLTWQPSSQELQQDLAVEETCDQKSKIEEIKGSSSLEVHDSHNEDIETKVFEQDTQLTATGESENEQQQAKANSNQYDNEEQQPHTITSTLQSETNKDEPLLDSTTQLEGHTAGQVEQQETLIHDSQSEDIAAADTAVSQSEQTAPELQQKTENEMDINNKLEATGAMVVNDEAIDCTPSVELDVLTPEEGTPQKDIKDERTVSPGHSEQGSGIEDHYMVSVTPSQHSLDGIETTAIDEVSDEDTIPVTTIDDADDVEQGNETSNKTTEIRETDTQEDDRDKMTVEEKTDSDIL